MKKIYLLLCLFYANYLNAQTSPTIPAEGVEITKAIPASPDAAALGKYGSIPVGLYTGVPDISIPIYTISSGAINLPISLSYHAGGNKVEEMASSVGLGWTLNAGGVITRTIRGIADEDISGFLDPAHYFPNILSTLSTNSPYTTAQLDTYLNEMYDGTMDGEADIYNYNFGNYSGKFVMDSYGNVTTIPQQKIKFTFTVGEAPDGPPMILSFTAITPDGVTYVFGADNDGNNAYETTATVNSCSTPTKPKYYAISWFIKKIVDPTGHEIDFNYSIENYAIQQTARYTRYQFVSTTAYGPPITSMPEQICNATNTIRGCKLNNITFEIGQINFHASPRNDVSNTNLIDSLSIVGGGLFKTYRLYYTNNNTSRLRLDSLADYIPSTTLETNVKVERYHFQYNPDSWTSYLTFNQDYWGYNNGQNNASPIPSTYYYLGGSGTPTFLPGANRSTNEQAMLGGMLTKITYPTGGYTVFTYETNQESNLDLGGTSSRYPPIHNEFGKSNDPSSYVYNYDIIHDDPEDILVISSPSGATVPVGITASGLETTDANTNDVTANLSKLDASGNDLPNGINGGVQVKNSDTIVYLDKTHQKDPFRPIQKGPLCHVKVITFAKAS